MSLLEESKTKRNSRAPFGTMSLECALICHKCSKKVTHPLQDCAEMRGDAVEIRCLQCRQKRVYCLICGKVFSHTSRLLHAKSAAHQAAKLAAQEAKLAAQEANLVETTTKNTAELAEPAHLARQKEQPAREQPVPAREIITGKEELLRTNVVRCPQALKIPQHPSNEWLSSALKGTPLATPDQMWKVFDKLEHGTDSVGLGLRKYEAMFTYYLCDLASHGGNQACACPPDRSFTCGVHQGFWGGGLKHLTQRAHWQKNVTQLGSLKMPTMEESIFQTLNLIQHQSMTPKQRSRQTKIAKSLASLGGGSSSIETFLPGESQLGRFFGVTGQHSMLNSLPCPKAELIEGIAYVPPQATIAMLFGCGIPIDDLHVSPDSGVAINVGGNDMVHDVAQCSKVSHWMKEMWDRHYGSDRGEHSRHGGDKDSGHNSDKDSGCDSGVDTDVDSSVDSSGVDTDVDSSVDSGVQRRAALSKKRAYRWCNVRGRSKKLKRFPRQKAPDVVVCLTLSDWADGFGPSRVKCNRTSVALKTFTISPPKQEVNGTKNTYPVAFGMKANKRGWQAINERFHRDLEVLLSSDEPIEFYHGHLKKMVPCVFRRMAVISDRPERSDLTGTLGHTGDTHRCFATCGKVETVPCKKEELASFLEKQSLGQTSANFGWCEKFVNKKLNLNGAVLPACLPCRKQNLAKLGLQFRGARLNDQQECSRCCNWDPIGSGSRPVLTYQAHDAWPTRTVPGCPVTPPPGRDIFVENAKLPFVKLNWGVMKAAVRFAFFQACQPQSKGWTSDNTTKYLLNCGLNGDLAKAVYDAAKKCHKSGGLAGIDFTDKNGIGDFKFPAPWRYNDISLCDYIEGVMHLVFLGLTKSNFLLIRMWLTDTPGVAKSGVAESPFLNALQNLTKDLRKFGLSWLAAYPLTGQKGNLGTGSWVAENYVYLARVSAFIFGWCARDEEKANKYGLSDMSRMVISFHCLVARLLTHGGVNSARTSEIAVYMKEFLSCVREFDVRLRYKYFSKNGEKRKGDTNEHWWLKSNYMSLPNLLYVLETLGPLVLWWDGGGKGERFIQTVKPHIKRGIREDLTSVFVNLLDKVFRTLQLDCTEEMIQDSQGVITTTDAEESQDDDDIDSDIGVDDDDDGDCDDNDDSVVDENTDDKDEETDDEEEEPDEEDPDEAAAAQSRPDIVGSDLFSRNEILGMKKTRTIYVYRRESDMAHAVLTRKPLAGYVAYQTEDDGSTNGTPLLQFRVVYRLPGKRFAARAVNFDDTCGVDFNGMWSAPLNVDPDVVHCATKFEQIENTAMLAAVAIPLRYALDGKRTELHNHFCVITNWWRCRSRGGGYQLPCLDASLYKARTVPQYSSAFEINAPTAVTATTEATEDCSDGVSVTVRGDQQFGLL